MNMRVLRVFTVVTATLTMAASCATQPTAAPEKPRKGGSLVVGSWQELGSLLAAGIVDRAPPAVAYESPMLEGLVTRVAASISSGGKASDRFMPQLATEVPTVENGGVKVSGTSMNVTYKLRPGVKWHDGQPFTSQDVVDTANFYYLKYGEANPTPLLTTSGWNEIASVDAPDPLVAVVNFKSVYGPYLNLFSGPDGVLPSHLLKATWAAGGDMTKTKLGLDLTSSNRDAYKGLETWDRWVIGTGPFVFKEWVRGDHLTMVRNDAYWGPHQPYLDRITVKFEADIDTEFGDLRTESIQLALDLRPGLIGPLQNVANIRTDLVAESGSEKLDLNLKNRYLADRTIREAINLTIDKQALADRLGLRRSLTPPDSIICLGAASWCADSSIPATALDRVAARTLLDGAGYGMQVSGAGAGYRAFSDGTTIALDLVTTAGNVIREKEQAQIAADLATVGIKINRPFKNPTAASLFGSFAAGGILYNQRFDMALYGNTVPLGEPDGWSASYACDQVPGPANGGVGMNDTHECNPAVDSAFRAGRASLSTGERRDAYVAAAVALAHDLPEIHLYQQLTVLARNASLRGYVAGADSWMAGSSDWYLAG